MKRVLWGHSIQHGESRRGKRSTKEGKEVGWVNEPQELASLLVLSHVDEGIEARFPVGDEMHLLIHERSCDLCKGQDSV